jgi:hypothetical protein
MDLRLLAALAALVSASPLTAQSGAFPVDPRFATPLSGNWTYSVTAGATQAAFVASSSRTQLALKCTRATRQVWISKPSAGPVAQLSVWTSEMTRNLTASFDPSIGQVTAVLTAYDPLLDALALSRARIAVSVPGAPPLVLPSSPEVTRIIEDCRA